jgi:hypothetical protein
MNRLNYDFSGLYNSIEKLRTDSDTMDVRTYINMFFKDSNCRNVIFTENIDKMFFGIIVYPWIEPTDADDILLNTESKRIKEYSIEIDSKLFDEMMGLTNTEISALIIKEIASMVNTSEPVERTKHAIDDYLIRSNKEIIISKSIQYRELLAFALMDTMYKVSSIFFTNIRDFIADEFSIMCGHAAYIESAIDKLNRSGLLFDNYNHRLIVLEWALNLYTDIKSLRIKALETINECITMSPSTLEIRALKNIAREIQRIDDSTLISESGESIREIIKNMKYRGLTNLEDDLYEYNIRLKTATTEDDARLLMREINNRMAILMDYINHEEIPENERDKWLKLYDKYASLREKLANKPISKFKYMNLWIDSNPNTLMY